VKVPGKARNDIDVQKGDDRNTPGAAVVLMYLYDPHSEDRTGKVKALTAV
jgi:hypothetical protein